MAERLREVWSLLSAHQDVLSGRVVGPEPPAWSEVRSWTPYLLNLADHRLELFEVEGLASGIKGDASAPPTLHTLATAIQSWTDFPLPVVDPGPLLRKASPRKRAQVAALVTAARRLAPPRRVVDVGAGQGHLTRELARELDVPAMGIERNPANVAEAERLREGEQAGFVVQETDAERLRFTPGDLVVGLHACGGLGDALVQAAARDGVDVLLVNCCLQKVGDGPRLPVSALGRELGLEVPRELLGLTNLLSRRTLVEKNPQQVMAGRQTRYALRLLLRERGLDVAPGEEMRGLHKRRTFRGLAHAAERACEKRGLTPPTAAELTAIEARAAAEFGRVRRFSLARSMLGRLLELAIVLDRAELLEEAGHAVNVEVLFPPEVSPRNLAIVARA
jgi:SAM-dependent methyltransferase